MINCSKLIFVGGRCETETSTEIECQLTIAHQSSIIAHQSKTDTISLQNINVF